MGVVRFLRRVLELGAYVQMTPVLGCILGYDQVRGAYYGSLGRVDRKTSTIDRYPEFLYEQ